MGARTGIEWADATVNIWEGCTKISPACKHCYAETNSPVRAMEVRIGEALQVDPSADGKRRLKMWGQSGFRYETANWERELRALNRKAKQEQDSLREIGYRHIYERPRIFINSLSDTFEDWQGAVYALEDGKPVTPGYSLWSVRERFFHVAEECTELDILLLTKRPENVLRMAPGWWRMHTPEGVLTGWPSHIWIGATVEDQAHADKRIPELLKVPAKVRFLSVEPLLGKVELGAYLGKSHWPVNSIGRCGDCDYQGPGPGHVCPVCVHWCIVGGESGANARPMHPDWVRSIRDQCVAAGLPFFFKQWGEYAPRLEVVNMSPPYRTEERIRKVGKKNAGRVLDGRTWDEVPR